MMFDKALEGVSRSSIEKRHEVSMPRGGLMMSFEKNKALARRYQEEVWGKGNLSLIDELVAAEARRRLRLSDGRLETT